MQFTLEALKVIEESLVKILREDLPIRMSYKLSKLYDVIESEMKKVETLRQDLVKRYGEETPEGNIQVSQANIGEFNREFFELMSMPVEAEYEPIDIKIIMDYSDRLKELGKSEINLSAIDLHQLKMVGILKEGE